jgi:hypothetical protein
MDIQNLAVCVARHMTSQIVVFKTQESKHLTLKENCNLTKYCVSTCDISFRGVIYVGETLLNLAYILHSNQDMNCQKWATIFRRVGKIAKSDPYLRHVCPPVCLSAWNDSTLTGRIFMKFDI